MMCTLFPNSAVLDSHPSGAGEKAARVREAGKQINKKRPRLRMVAPEGCQSRIRFAG